MAERRHFLSEIDTVSRTAVCSLCGPVAIKLKGEVAPRCRNALRQEERQRDQRRRQAGTKARSNATKIRRVNALKNRPCADCGVAYPPYVMDFDHRDPATKLGNIASMVRDGVAWSTIENEIAKCDVVCANCHRERTHGTTYNRGHHKAGWARSGL